MLKSAGSLAIYMPKLQTLEIWNGRKNLAGVFRYHFVQNLLSTLTWRGTWELVLEPSIVQTWEAVVAHRGGRGLSVAYERVDRELIKSHADAIIMLGLPELVIRPVSLQQIEAEQGPECPIHST